MSTNTKIITPLPPEPPSVVEQRTAYLRRRRPLSSAVAATLAELAFASSPCWRGRA